MGNAVLFRYLSLTVRSNLGRLSTNSGLVAVLITVLSLMVGGLFWLIGSLSSNEGFLSAGLFGLALIGIWGGLSYVSAYRPSGWSWLRKSDWLWLKALPVILIGLLSAAVTIGPFYLGQYQYGLLLETIEVKVIVLLLALAVVFFGLFLSVGVKRATQNPYLRLLWVVMGAYFIGVLLFSTQVISNVNQAILSRSGDTLLILLLTALGIFVTGLLALQLAFDNTKLTCQIRMTFWQAQPTTRLLGLIRRPAVGYFLARLTLYARSSFAQRRIAVFLLLAIILQVISTSIALSFQTILAIQLSLVWFLAYSIGSISGRSAAEENHWLKTLPISFSPRTVSYLAMSLLLLVGMALAAAFFPLTSAIVLAISALSIGVAIFDWSYRARRSQLTPVAGELSGQDRGIFGGVLVSLVFVALPIVLNGLVSPVTVSGLMILWLVGFSLNNKIASKLK